MLEFEITPVKFILELLRLRVLLRFWALTKNSFCYLT